MKEQDGPEPGSRLFFDVAVKTSLVSSRDLAGLHCAGMLGSLVRWRVLRSLVCFKQV